ncbi:MAG: filamentous hemagglutinin N-terminal domain-containing protein, partial [Methyloglobulus sp.]
MSEHLRLKPLSACIRIALAGGVLMGYVTPGFAQNNVLPIPAQVWSTFGSASHKIVGGNTLQINQTSDRAILNWEKFNVGTKNQVKFQQPNSTSIALNRIFQDDPSQILGKITANGQIYLYNKNGFVFGKDSTVNANTLVASALNISPEVFKTSGIVNYFKDSGGGAALVAEPGSSKAAIDVKAGAKIHIGENGRLIMAAPTVTNAGSIETDKFGQIILVASKDKVYLQPTDSTTNKDFAGLLVEVGTGGQVTNAKLGNILARQGNVTLAGFAVNQSGRISATTATNVNGSIRLLAREGGINKGGTLESSTTIRSEDLKDGLGTKAKVTFAAGSKTQIIADPDGGKAIDGQKQPLSYMQVSAHTVHLQSGSALGVPGGKINIEASTNPSIPTSTTDSNNQPNNQGRIILDSGALIDVSGTKNITASVSRNVVGVPVQSFELRDSPLQKGGVLQGQTIQVDIRDKTPIADTSGAEALIERGIDERLGKGGTINLTSAGDVIVNPGAKINISGGTINYQAGYINTSKLLTDYGKIIDISDADPNEHYQAVFGAYKEVHEKWGVTKIWQADGLFGKGQFEQGYQEGLDAGALNITTANLSWNGDLVAGAASGLFQRDATSKSFGGEFSINNNSQNFFNPTQNVLFQTQGNGLNLTLDDEFPVDNDNQPADLVLSTDSINHSGIQKLSIKTQGNATIASGANIEMTPGKSGEIVKLPTIESTSSTTQIIKGSQFDLVADDIDVQGSILAAGGNIKLTSGTNPGSVDPTIGFTSGLLTVGPKANLDVSGLWVNDFALGLDATPTEDIVTDAGSVSLTAAGGLDLQAGSAIHADGGAWLTQNGQLTAGKGGAINLATQKLNDTGLPPAFQINGKLSAYSLSEGGSLSLAPFAEKIIVGVPDTADLLSSPLVLGVEDGYLDIDGIKSFGEINVSGGLNLTVKENTTLNLIQQNWFFKDNYQQQASSNSIAAFSKIETLPDHLRKPVDLSLTSESINLETGSKILGDKQATIKLAAKGLGGIYVDGLIDAPAGTIDLKILASDALDYVPTQAIWLGQHGQLQAKGTTILNPLDGLGKITGDVLDGGDISLSTNRGYVILEEGSKIDVSGTKAKLDILSADPGSTHTVSTQVGSNAGKITLQAAEGGVFDGELLGLAGSATTNGGRLDLILDRSQRPISDIFPPPFGSLTLNVQQNYTKQLDDKAQFGANLDELGLNGKATIGSDKITGGGFDDLRLKVLNVNEERDSNGVLQLAEKNTFVNFLGDVNLTVGNLIDIDAPAIGWLGLNDETTGSVTLNTAYLRVGSSRFELREPTQLPISGGGKFTANTLWTEFGGGSRWDGFNTLNFKSEHDIRAVGILKEESNTESVPKNSSDFVGKLMTAADINFTASQIYPSTLTKFTFAVANNPTGKITVSPSGNNDISPLSAGGVLNFEASTINQNGTIKAPFGTINLTASKSLSLGNGSLTSVSGAGQLIPFGVISAGQDWLYPLQQTSLVLNAPPEKKLVLSAPQVNIKKGSTVDLSGGGDLLAYEFQPGIGGSFDYLDSNSPSYNGGFAILPNLGSSLAPFDHAQGLLGNYQAVVGSQVFLNGTDKLAAGFYTILPARYALLPGAFFITPQAETQDQKATTINSAGLPVVGGFQALAGTGTQDARWSGFLIESGTDIRKHSQYEELTANNFYTQRAVSKETITPILPKDSGQVVIKNAQTKLTLDGDFKVSSPGGRGARMDIAADRLKIVKALSATPTAGILEVLADDLTGLNIGSLLLGGERTSNINTGATDITVSSEEVVFDKNAHVQATDLIVAATQKITVKKGAELIAKGSVKTGDKILNVSGDGALLKLSSDQPVSLNRKQAPGNAGVLLVEAGATLSANKSMLIDAAQSTKVFGDIQMQGGSLNLSANNINIGEVGSLLSNDLNLSNSELSKLTVDELILTGRETINFYGNVGKLDGTGVLNPLTFDRLVINAAGLSGFGKANQSVGLQANSILFQNTFGVTSSKQGTGSGELNISATSYNQGNGIFNINGFNSVNIDAAKDFKSAGNGTLNIDSNLHLTSGYIASSAGKKLNINTIGYQALFDSHANTNVPTITDFGGTVNVTANAINFNAEAVLPSGQLGLHSLNGDVLVGSQAQIDLAGRKVRFADAFDYTPGGTFSAIADQGKIVLAAGSKVDVSTGGGKAAGGKLDLQAAKQNIELLGELKAKAGSAMLDVAGFSVKSGFDGLMDVLMAAGVSNELSVRSRQDNIVQGSANSITANNITLSADQGDVILSSKLNADGISQGGVIKVYAGDKVSLAKDAELSAKGTGNTANGGKVLLSSTDVDSDHKNGIEINSESSIDVSGGSKGNGGEVVLRALRTDSDNNGVDDGVAIKPIAADVVTGFSGFYAEGVKKYSYEKDSDQDFVIAGEINEFDIFPIKENTDTYMTSDNIKHVSETLDENRKDDKDIGIHLRPGIEINYDGDLTLKSQWDFVSWGDDLVNFGEKTYLPGTLNINVSGNFTLEK